MVLSGARGCLTLCATVTDAHVAGRKSMRETVLRSKVLFLAPPLACRSWAAPKAVLRTLGAC